MTINNNVGLGGDGDMGYSGEEIKAMERHQCPECDSPLNRRSGIKGAVYACADRSCGFFISERTLARLGIRAW